jgi:hypothetical protein
MKTDLGPPAAPAIAAAACGLRMARPTGVLGVLLYHLTERIEFRPPAESIEACGDLLPTGEQRRPAFSAKSSRTSSGASSAIEVEETSIPRRQTRELAAVTRDGGSLRRLGKSRTEQREARLVTVNVMNVVLQKRPHRYRCGPSRLCCSLMPLLEHHPGLVTTRHRILLP